MVLALTWPMQLKVCFHLSDGVQIKRQRLKQYLNSSGVWGLHIALL